MAHSTSNSTVQINFYIKLIDVYRIPISLKRAEYLIFNSLILRHTKWVKKIVIPELRVEDNKQKCK